MSTISRGQSGRVCRVVARRSSARADPRPCRLSLHAGKQPMVYSRLSRRLRETGQRSFGDYLQWLEAARGAEATTE
jgi:chemotaxis methyl-accepting protein methylase